MNLKYADQNTLSPACSKPCEDLSPKDIFAKLEAAQSLQKWDERLAWQVYSAADDLRAEGQFSLALQLYRLLMQTKVKLLGTEAEKDDGLSLERLAIKEIERAHLSYQKSISRDLRDTIKSNSQSKAGFPNLKHFPVDASHERHEIIGSLLQRFRAWAKRIA